MTYPPALPKWEGGLSVDGCDGFPGQWLVDVALASLLVGETGEGEGEKPPPPSAPPLALAPCKGKSDIETSHANKRPLVGFGGG